MPTYEYACDACKKKFEMFQPITSKPVKKCPRCGKSSVRRLISAGAGILFKGSGFYQTDYRTKGYHEAAKKDAPAKESKASETPAKSSESSAKSSESRKDTPSGKSKSKKSPEKGDR